MSSPARAVNRQPPTSSLNTSTLALLSLCFFLSGIAALAYQTAWTRQFALVFGTSELAVATVLAAYMGGLALGAAIVERLLPRLRRPLFSYALLELGIGASALMIVPAALWASNATLLGLFGEQPAPPSSEQLPLSGFYLLSAFVALALPTALMGATLPLLARQSVIEDAHIGRRIATLYACNTAGAVVGALVTAFVLLPDLGLTHTVWVAAAINAIVFIAAWVLLTRTGFGELDAVQSPRISATAARTRFTAARGPVWVLPLMLCAGAVAFMQEVLWTRMLSHVVGSSIYAFGVMVASFLAGIAAGGAVAAPLAHSRVRSIDILGIALAICALWSAAAFWLLEHFLPATAGLFANQSGNALFGFALLLPLTFAIGLTYPLAVRILADQAAAAAAASARVYAWNTVGAILGALAAGFWLIPAFRYEGAIVFAAVGSALLSAAALAVLAPGEIRSRVALGIVIVASLAAIWYRPGAPQHLLLSSPLNVSGDGKLLYYGVGRSASVVILQQDGGLVLRTNGLPEAMMDGPGSVPRFSGEYWLSPLAVIARPQARDVLVVGLGGGVILEAMPPSVRSVDVIELEPLVIDANRATRSLRKLDPLQDPRITLVTNDARGALALTRKRYDAIVSQPSHPWTAGASHLYTREFMRQARDHLSDGGVFVQWMNVAFVDESLLRSLTATLIDVFGQLRIYRPDPNTLIFLASTAPFDIESRLARGGEPLHTDSAHYGRYGINALEDLIAALYVDEEGARQLGAGAALITDDDNRMATSSVFEWNRGLSADALSHALRAYDPLQNPRSWVYRDYGQTLSFEYIARREAFLRTLDASLVERIEHIQSALGGSAQGTYIRSILLRIGGDAQQAQALVQKAAEQFPDNGVLGYADLLNQQVADGAAPLTLAQQSAIARLPTAAQASLRGLALLSQGRLQALAELDDSLAQSSWTDPWFMDSNQLRAEWRARVSNAELRQRMGDEAIALLDHAALQQPTLNTMMARVRASLTSQRQDALLESLANAALWMAAQTAQGDSTTAARRRESAGQLLQLLEQQSRLPGMDATRLEEVRSRLTALQRRP